MARDDWLSRSPRRSESRWERWSGRERTREREGLERGYGAGYGEEWEPEEARLESARARRARERWGADWWGAGGGYGGYEGGYGAGSDDASAGREVQGHLVRPRGGDLRLALLRSDAVPQPAALRRRHVRLGSRTPPLPAVRSGVPGRVRRALQRSMCPATRASTGGAAARDTMPIGAGAPAPGGA